MRFISEFDLELGYKNLTKYMLPYFRRTGNLGTLKSLQLLGLLRHPVPPQRAVPVDPTEGVVKLTLVTPPQPPFLIGNPPSLSSLIR